MGGWTEERWWSGAHTLAEPERRLAQFMGKRARQAIGTLLDDMEGFNATLDDTEDSAGKNEAAFVKMSDTSAQKAAKSLSSGTPRPG